MLITVDAGHGPTTNPFPPAPKFYEGTQMWKLSQYLETELKNRGLTAVNTRSKLSDNPSVTARGQMAACCKAGMILSLHSNAAGAADVTGTEIYYSIKGSQYSELASRLAAAVAGVMGHHVRGTRTRRSTTDPKSDYYGVIRSAANSGCTCAMILEHGFHTNRKDALFLADDANLKKLAVAEAKIIADYINIKPAPPYTSETLILSAPTASLAQAKAWAAAGRATDVFIALADIYWDIGAASEINPVAAYCQSAKETGYGRFGGVLDAGYFNPCGLKTRDGGGDKDKNAHQRFKNWNEGVKAHIDHLALYAGALGYPKAVGDTPDPRHARSLYGVSKTVEGLSTHWASSSTYGKEIASMMSVLEKTPCDDAVELTLRNAFDDGVITDKDYWRKVLSGRQSANPDYIKLVIDRYHMKVRV